nr:nucleoside hydrolase [Paracoccus saliphilus]
MTMHKVILDSDPGVDDALALYYLVRHPRIDLLGVTTVFGNAPVAITTRNARFLLKAWGCDTPVRPGASGPLTPDMPPEDYPVHIHGKNGLGDYPVSDAEADEPDNAAQFLIDQIRANPGQVRVLAVGRLTNLARAVRLAPDIASLVNDVVIMGGAFRVPGNVTPAAEANIWGDPLAADVVFGAPWRVTAVPLDLTTRTFMTRQMLSRLASEGGPAMQLISDLSQDYVGFYARSGYDGMLIHDCTAAVYLTDPDLFDLTQGEVRVLSQGIGMGLTLMNPVSRHGPLAAWEGRPRQFAALDGQPHAILSRIARTCTGQ